MFDVLFAANDEYAPYLGVSIYSLLKNNHNEFDEICIYVLDDNISEINKNKVKTIVNHFNAQINFIETKNIELLIKGKTHSMDKDGISSITTYFRLFSASTFINLDKILYLDCDSLINGSYKDLWAMDISEYYVAGVLDTVGVDFVKNEIGLENHHKYINAGVLLLNLKKWRKENVEEKFVNFLDENYHKFIFHDQGVINGVLKDKILYLDPKYNLQGQFHGIDYKKAIKWGGFPDYYDEVTVMNAQKNPVFIHFTGSSSSVRPWANKDHYYSTLYYSYVKETPFKEDIKLEKIPLSFRIFFRIYKSKFSSFILNLMPMSFFVKFSNKRIKNVCERELKDKI